MKKRGLTIASAILLSATAGVWAYQGRSASQETSYRFVQVERGDIVRSVAATGNLGAVTTVSVGTQVSGQVAELFVDFNDQVEKGQLLARIDPTLAEQSVVDAQSTVDRTRAELLAAEREYDRNRDLLAQGLVAESAFDSVESRLAVAKANVRSAEVSLDRARQNLSYTEIYAPIDGVVVERNVDSGQTVAASLQAPQLFLIANDLSRMQILVQVDESDIALISKGQSVSFSVQALPRETFEGKVQQVRLQSTMQESVVSYTVVVEVDNSEGKLLPGMTASVDFRVASAENVLRIPNAALRFRPDDAVLAQLRSPAGAEIRAGGSGAPQREAISRGRGTEAQSSLFYLDSEAGAISMVRVETGISDGSWTEVRGKGLREGMQVIAGTARTTSAETGESAFGQGQSQNSRRGGAF